MLKEFYKRGCYSIQPVYSPMKALRKEFFLPNNFSVLQCISRFSLNILHSWSTWACFPPLEDLWFCTRLLICPANRRECVASFRWLIIATLIELFYESGSSSHNSSAPSMQQNLFTLNKKLYSSLANSGNVVKLVVVSKSLKSDKENWEIFWKL